ncbi:hypothetical protein SAMN04487881_2384 [Marinobacter sp. es.048]|nr:hypothetical protein SAMN04487881_2384 [Marinobacter sp. es.048]
MTALAYLRRHGLEAESLTGDRIAVWPEEAITPALELWIIEHKPELVRELQHNDSDPLTPWRIFIDGKCIGIMLSTCTTPEDARNSAQQRWPRKCVQAEEFTPHSTYLT